MPAAGARLFLFFIRGPGPSRRAGGGPLTEGLKTLGPMHLMCTDAMQHCVNSSQGNSSLKHMPQSLCGVGAHNLGGVGAESPLASADADGDRAGL